MGVIVTLFTDAGWCPNLNRASWGAWAKSDRGVMRAGGVFRQECRSSNIAEARAVANGLATALKEGIIHPGDTVIVQTDNCAVPAIIFNQPAKKPRSNTQARRDIGEYASRLIAEKRLKVQWRHVKGHAGRGKPRHVVNEYCDQVASYFLALERSRLEPHRYAVPTYVPYGINEKEKEAA